MRLRRRTSICLRLVALAALTFASANTTYSSQVAPDGRIADDAIARALATLRTDPNLVTERSLKTLQWKSSAARQRSRMPSWLAWVAGLFQWLEQSARILVWSAAAVLAGLIGVYIYRLVRSRRIGAGNEDGFVAPTHVRDLDIRPETLPDDIGAAARAFWDRGEERIALALLYRGMLSRLAHVHRLPIRDSTTEGDCLALTASRLSQDTHGYTSTLVQVWQRFVYGRESVSPGTVYRLCDDFSAALDAAVSPHLAGGAA